MWTQRAQYYCNGLFIELSAAYYIKTIIRDLKSSYIAAAIAFLELILHAVELRKNVRKTRP